ncbi:Myb/SANT-like DNA-binding domain-containing protein [Mycena latifolia]|nr:Myb/SANT-like DNA-binding domain-containing protein [Mycena latifolia]
MPKDKTTNDTSSDVEDPGGKSKKTRTREVWSAAELAILVRILLEEKKLGRQAESGWTSESYTKVAIALKARGIVRSNKQIKSCWTRLKGQYKIVKGIRSLSGFGWNATTKCVTATDEVWDAYLSVTSCVQDASFIHYDDMALLCDDVMATGEDTFSNGASGGNQTTHLGSDDVHDGTGSMGAGDEGDNEEEADDDEGDRDISSSSTPFLGTPKPVKNTLTAGAASGKKVGSKRARNGRVSSTSALSELAASVESLAASFQDDSQRGSHSSDSPARCKEAWNAMIAEEGEDLSDNELAAASEDPRGTKVCSSRLA